MAAQPSSQPVLAALFPRQLTLPLTLPLRPPFVYLQEAVRAQIDYYFSVGNMVRDVFLRSKMDSEVREVGLGCAHGVGVGWDVLVVKGFKCLAGEGTRGRLPPAITLRPQQHTVLARCLPV